MSWKCWKSRSNRIKHPSVFDFTLGARVVTLNPSVSVSSEWCCSLWVLYHHRCHCAVRDSTPQWTGKYFHSSALYNYLSHHWTRCERTRLCLLGNAQTSESPGLQPNPPTPQLLSRPGFCSRIQLIPLNQTDLSIEFLDHLFRKAWISTSLRIGYLYGLLFFCFLQLDEFPTHPYLIWWHSSKLVYTWLDLANKFLHTNSSQFFSYHISSLRLSLSLLEPILEDSTLPDLIQTRWIKL